VPTTMLAGSAGLSKDAACAILVATPSAILRNTEPAYLGDIHTCIIDEADMLLDGASPLPVSHAHTQLLYCLDPLHGLGCHVCIYIHIHVYLRVFICIYICVYIYTGGFVTDVTRILDFLCPRISNTQVNALCACLLCVRLINACVRVCLRACGRACVRACVRGCGECRYG